MMYSLDTREDLEVQRRRVTSPTQPNNAEDGQDGEMEGGVTSDHTLGQDTPRSVRTGYWRITEMW